MKFLRDIQVGEQAVVGAYTFTAENIVSFARRYDPQPFHLSEEAAAKTHFRHLCASGWHTASAWMGLMVAYRKAETEAQIARGERIPESGVGAGLRDLQWIRPVYVGDVVTYTTEVVEARASASRPGWGVIGTRATGVNQKGEPVISFISVGFLQWAPPGAN